MAYCSKLDSLCVCVYVCIVWFSASDSIYVRLAFLNSITLRVDRDIIKMWIVAQSFGDKYRYATLPEYFYMNSIFFSLYLFLFSFLTASLRAVI